MIAPTAKGLCHYMIARIDTRSKEIVGLGLDIQKDPFADHSRLALEIQMNKKCENFSKPTTCSVEN
jgi:hypothetical protein